MNKRLVAVLCILLVFMILIVGCSYDRYSTHPPIKEECSKNEDCGENQVCSDGKCIVINCPNGTIISGDSRTCCKPDSECLKDSDCHDVHKECFYCKCLAKKYY